MLESMAFSSFVIHDDRPSGSRLPREGAEEPEGPEQAQMDVADHGSVPTARPCSLSSKDSRTSSLSSLTINDGATHRRTVSASTLQDNKTHWGKDVDDFGLPSPSIYSTESLLLPSHEIPEPRLDLLSVTRLWIAHTEKIYFSGPVIWRMERGTNGRRSSRRDGWVAGWAQLSGARLSLWDNEEEVVSAPGTEVPTCYVNITDAVCLDSAFAILALTICVLRRDNSSFMWSTASPFLPPQTNLRKAMPISSALIPQGKTNFCSPSRRESLSYQQPLHFACPRGNDRAWRRFTLHI
jgi:hypothetical protein